MSEDEVYSINFKKLKSFSFKFKTSKFKYKKVVWHSLVLRLKAWPCEVVYLCEVRDW